MSAVLVISGEVRAVSPLVGSDSDVVTIDVEPSGPECCVIGGSLVLVTNATNHGLTVGQTIHLTQVTP